LTLQALFTRPATQQQKKREMLLFKPCLQFVFGFSVGVGCWVFSPSPLLAGHDPAPLA